MRSEAATPPGSRSARTGTPSSSSARASAAASVVLPDPSRPSMLTRRPRGTAATISTMPVGMTATLEGTKHHPHARAVLGAALAPGARPSHAYLFHGPAGTGKGTAARAFAAELLADGAADPERVRARVAAGVHPDFTWVAPSGVHEMRVDDVAEPVVSAATRTPFEARRRVFVLERADTLHERAANRLLKTLEEPAEYVHLIL